VGDPQRFPRPVADDIRGLGENTEPSAEFVGEILVKLDPLVAGELLRDDHLGCCLVAADRHLPERLIRRRVGAALRRP
jgi:hypothetical protein